MHSRSKKLKRKLRACAGLTGSGTLVAAASLGLVSKGHSAIVTLQLNDHVAPNSQVSYDVDGDGELDVTFRTGTASSLSITGASMAAEFLQIGGCTFGVCGSIVRYDSLGYSLVQAHQPGELISTSATPCSRGVNFYNAAWLNIGSSGPFFEPTSPRYAGFGFVASTVGDTLLYNGWAEVQVTEPTPGDYELEVIAIGYETDPFTPVPAGGFVTAVTNDTPPIGLSLRNTPNPFNEQTKIEFQLPESGTVAIRIYDAAGRLVRTVMHTRAQKGLNSVEWDAHDEAGKRVPSGVYFCRLEAFGITRAHKMVVVE
jgi:hypothetical protein